MKLNIAAYRFESIADVPALADAVRARCEALVLRGSVLVAPEGINLFLAGEEGAVRRFLDWLRRDVRFATIEAKESWSDEVPFARLKVKQKREIVPFGGRPAGQGGEDGFGLNGTVERNHRVPHIRQAPGPPRQR